MRIWLLSETFKNVNVTILLEMMIESCERKIAEMIGNMYYISQLKNITDLHL